jgi:RimJ/RimL family protein N-acetyltransferase
MMIKGEHLVLRPVTDADWPVLERWGQEREGLWGPFQRFQLDHLSRLREIYLQTGLLKRESGLLLVETILEHEVIGFVRYTLIPFPDEDHPYPEIGFGLPEASARGKGYAKEAVALLVDYLFGGYATERIAAFTDEANIPARRMMESLGFWREGLLHRAMFRDGEWQNIEIYAILREDWKAARQLADSDEERGKEGDA